MILCFFLFFFFKQKTAYEITTGDWSSDVCSSDLEGAGRVFVHFLPARDDFVGAPGRGALRRRVHGGGAGPALGARGGEGIGDLVPPRGAAAAPGVVRGGGPRPGAHGAGAGGV